MKIDSLYLHQMRNDAHFQFFNEFRTEVDGDETVKLKIKPKYDVLVAIHTDEDTALKKIQKSIHTTEMRKFDKERDNTWRGLEQAVKLATMHYDPFICRAGEKIKIVLDTYGDVTKKPYEEETSAIYNTIQDIRGRFASDASITGITGWINKLESVNTSFNNLMKQRFDETAAKTDLTLKDVRPKIDAVYYEIVEYINAAIIIEGEEPYRNFVTTLNVIIKRHNDVMAQKKGRAAAKK